MKRLILTLVILLGLNCANAQLFQQNESRTPDRYDRRGFDPEDPPNPDPGAPLGSGLLILTGLSAGYVCFNKRSQKRRNSPQ